MIGSSGKDQARNSIAGITTVMYMWQNGNGSNMNATFQNNSLVSVAQAGLQFSRMGRKLWVGAELESEFLKEHKDEEIQKVIDELDILIEEEIRKEQDKTENW